MVNPRLTLLCRDREVRHDPSCRDVAIDNPGPDHVAHTSREEVNGPRSVNKGMNIGDREAGV